MEKKRFRKQIALALAPLFVLSLLVFFKASSTLSEKEADENSGKTESVYASQEQKADIPPHEAVFISILKFIVNCNPFQTGSEL